MNFKALAARFALVVSCGLMTATPAAAQFWQCVTFARSVSGIEIRGNANTWWSQAEGRYERGHTPKAGSVLAFSPTSRMRVGHVAMVSKVVSDREVLLTHANWSRPGAIETNVRAVDVSPAGDWSMVKVWYGPQGDLGTSAYPTKGFIYSGHAPAGDTLDAPVQPSFQMASASHIVSATQRANAAQLATIQHGPTDPRGIFTLVNEAN
ncbi:CHAP domain-containing protein [Sphingomonas sp. Leaf230]|uniref:CHAP domain-containing protein n=1 Tax=Sphingomonas sp. Leaf230 TaxID=1735694 RepID=UPI0009E90286|nr:CHAP domain-containing protein [Sphingomonas sp. Leaf230]